MPPISLKQYRLMKKLLDKDKLVKFLDEKKTIDYLVKLGFIELSYYEFEDLAKTVAGFRLTLEGETAMTIFEEKLRDEKWKKVMWAVTTLIAVIALINSIS